MQIDLKTLLSFIPMLLLVGVTYGTFNTKVKALETTISHIPAKDYPAIDTHSESTIDFLATQSVSL